MREGTGARDVRLLVLSTGLSSLGDELALVALTIKVADLVGNGWAVGGLLLVGLLPMVLLAPVAGVIVDRSETRGVLVLASVVQAALAVALAFAGSLPTILVLSFFLGSFAAVANPAIFTLMPHAVGEARTTQGNAYLQSAQYAGMVAGPALAGSISSGPGTRIALLVDAATFVAIAAASGLLRVRRKPEAAEGTARGEARAGIRLVLRDRLLFITFGVVSAIVLFAAMDNVAEIFYARDALGTGDWGFGVLASVWLAGMVGGAAVIGRGLPPHRLLPAVWSASVIGGAAVALAGGLAEFWFAVAMFLVGGVANGVVTVSMRSVITRRVPERLRGRVFAAYAGLVNAMQIGAFALAAALVEGVGPRGVLVIAGTGTAIAGLIGMAAMGRLPERARSLESPSDAKILEIDPGDLGFTQAGAGRSGSV